MKEKIARYINPVSIILLAAVIRLMPHIPNVTPIAAMALFGGAYVNKRFALLAPLAVMVVSDIFLGFSLITPFVYGSFLLAGVIGLWLRTHKTAPLIIGASVVSSILFFLITNFGVWVVWSFYPKTLSGLLDCLVAGLPFFRNTLVGDVSYAILFFGGYELVQKFFTTKAYGH